LILVHGQNRAEIVQDKLDTTSAKDIRHLDLPSKTSISELMLRAAWLTPHVYLGELRQLLFSEFEAPIRAEVVHRVLSLQVPQSSLSPRLQDHASMLKHSTACIKPES
jgi:hypothetical protein